MPTYRSRERSKGGGYHIRRHGLLIPSISCLPGNRWEGTGRQRFGRDGVKLTEALRIALWSLDLRAPDERLREPGSNQSGLSTRVPFAFGPRLLAIPVSLPS